MRHSIKLAEILTRLKWFKGCFDLTSLSSKKGNVSGCYPPWFSLRLTLDFQWFGSWRSTSISPSGPRRRRLLRVKPRLYNNLSAWNYDCVHGSYCLSSVNGSVVCDWNDATKTGSASHHIIIKAKSLLFKPLYHHISGSPLPNILVAHLLVSCLGVIVGTLMVIVCLSLMREAGRFKTCDLTVSGPSSRVEGTCSDFDAKEEGDWTLMEMSQ